MTTYRLAAILAVVVPLGAGAQKSVVGVTGTLLRYHGDTIWVERDTTLTRVVYHGDTVSKLVMVDGRLRYSQVFLLTGDSARTIDFRDSAGVSHPMDRPLPAMVATMERQQLEMELLLDQTRQYSAQLS